MKFIQLCFLISLLVLLNTKALQGAKPDRVVDRHGKPLESGKGYYVWQFWAHDIGGLTLSSTRNKTCPLDVIRNPKELGSPVYFSAPGFKHIPTQTDLSIKIRFRSSSCNQSKVLKLSKEGSGFWFLSTGGVAGDVVSKFKIEKLEGDTGIPIYIFKFCPSVPGALCAPVRTFTDTDGTKVMAVGDGNDLEPYYVRFQRVSTFTPKNSIT
ncbi:putative proteinase inhibitor I3, Kunitz legume [Medicago truncatula]|uniref:Kunitz type trypsin inhibitor / Alpha-fucosidase n=1 Tax=Medicago truncatula TaxID=3880 RepID=A0A396IYK9_MEDTR|nr:kunitz trypsin inhibitor 5-like [Medicago truncatula]RHN70610.1 putative proteinase inhibitor I3, Kunitz legume [Medicago truncatula]